MNYRLPKIIPRDITEIIRTGKEAKLELPKRPKSNLSDLERKLIASLFSRVESTDSLVSAHIRGYLEHQQMSESVDQNLSDFIQMILYAGRENRTLPDKISKLDDEVALRYTSLAEDKELQLEIGTIAEDYFLQYIQSVREAIKGIEDVFPILFRFEADDFESAIAAINMLGLYGAMYAASERIYAKNHAMAGRFKAGFDVFYNPESEKSKSYLINSSHIADEDLFTIGRDAESSIGINGNDVSRHHCQIVCDNNKFYLRDTSKRGTQIIVAGEKKILNNNHIEYFDEMPFWVGDVKIVFSALKINY